MTLWEQYDAIIGEIAVTAYIERGECIDGWLAERQKIADALREQLLGSGNQSSPSHSATTRRSEAHKTEDHS